MGTRKFNILDTLIAKIRLSKVICFVEENDRVFDFGCGYQATLLRQVKKQISFGVGIDYELDNTATIDQKIKLIKYTYKNHLPFKKNTFNKVFLLAVLEHFNEKDAQKLFKEFFRILRKEGKVILTTPTPKSKGLLEFLANKMRIISSDEIMDHKKYYSKKSMLDLAKKTGFKGIKYDSFMFGLNSLCVMEKKS